MKRFKIQTTDKSKKMKQIKVHFHFSPILPLNSKWSTSCLCLWKFFTLIPIHNVLEQPNYWYEEFICRVLSCGVIVTCQNAIRAECWSNFTFDNKFATYIWLILIGHGLGLCAYAAHFYIWIIHFGLSQPLALGHFMIGTALVLAINTTIYFR